MRLILLLKKNTNKHKGSLIGIFLLFIVISLSIVISINIFINSSQYISQEMDRLGYGDITAWVSQNDHLEELTESLTNDESVGDIETQSLIYAGYSINNVHSDNDGQLIPYTPNKYDYKVLRDNFNYSESISINKNEIYISPSMHSTYNFNIGDQINFDIARGEKTKVFTIKGYFEDPFMGSSMIDMKSFLINTQDFYELSQVIDKTTSFNKLARNGTMLHISKQENIELSNTEFNKQINQNTELGQYTEFVYTQSSIHGFMMVQQNMLSGFLGAFVIVLLIVSMIVIGYNITHSIELERKDMGILKTIGYTSQQLRIVQILQYCISIICAMFVAFIISIILSQYLSSLMITSTGLAIPSRIPYGLCISIFLFILIMTILFIMFKTKQITKVSPIQTIQESQSQLSKTQLKMTDIKQGRFIWSLSLRQLAAGKKRYFGSFIIAILLIFFLSVVSKMNTWIGPNGEGLMDAFSVAKHDIGVQPMMNMDMSDVESTISSYANIEQTYELAMQNVLVNGVDYTANIINDSSMFHIIRGQTTQANNEIVVTEYAATDLGVDIGDNVDIMHNGKKADYMVVGIYQCANEMGANIGMNVEGYQQIGDINAYIWCKHYILSNHSMNNEIMAQLQNKYPLELAVHTNSWSGLDGIVLAMQALTIGMYIVVMFFILVVMILTGSKMLYSQQKDMAIFKSIGLTTHQLRLLFALRFGIVIFIGSIIGTIVSLLLTNPIISCLISMFGIGQFNVQLNFMNTIVPLIMITTVFTIFAYLVSYKIKRVSLTELIKGE